LKRIPSKRFEPEVSLKMKDLDYYIKKFAHLHTDTSPKRWSELTCHRAPHKPFLLLSILDLFAQKVVNTNLIEITNDLGELFLLYWSKIMPQGQRGNLALPFFHLQYEKFWHLVPKKGKENILSNLRQMRSIHQLIDLIVGACLDDELFFLLQNEKNQNLLRVVLIETYFSPKLRPLLIEQGKTNIEAYYYSQLLLRQSTKAEISDKGEISSEYRTAIRNQGFRRAVVTAYQHRCAFCGIRMLTPEGRTVVEAAHIIPWSTSHNDNIDNGLSLCRLCHWSFDEGLMSVSENLAVLISSRLTFGNNVPGHLQTLAGRGIVTPFQDEFFPAKEVLKWHRNNVFYK